jgi:hypothetical protein
MPAGCAFGCACCCTKEGGAIHRREKISTSRHAGWKCGHKAKQQGESRTGELEDRRERKVKL